MTAARIHAYLLSLPRLTPEHHALHILLSAWQSGPLPRESARRWAESVGAPNLAGDARKYLTGARAWPSRRKSRSPLIVAVEAWEASQAGHSAMSIATGSATIHT